MIVDNENDKDNTLCIALLYRYCTHTFAQIFMIVQLIVLLFISLVSFKIINSRSHNVFLHYYVTVRPSARRAKAYCRICLVGRQEK